MIEPRSNFQYECVPGSRELQIDTIDAQFYGNNECIEVSEIVPELPVVWNDLCEGDPQALMYSADQGDELFVLQNGSLLVLELGSLVSVFDSYCVEMTGDSQLLAKVCEQVRIDRIGVIEFFMLFSSLLAVLALLITALSYSFVPKLKDSFGYLIAVHAGTFAIGTIFFGLARCAGRCIDPANVGRCSMSFGVPPEQFVVFNVSLYCIFTEVTEMFSNALLGTSVFVFFLMNVYNTMYVAYYIPNGLEYENKNKRDMYAFLAVLYCITLVPLFLFPRGKSGITRRVSIKKTGLLISFIFLCRRTHMHRVSVLWSDCARTLPLVALRATPHLRHLPANQWPNEDKPNAAERNQWTVS